MQLYNHQFKNLPRERAEEIIEKQVMRVGKVITDLGLASESISGRVENLERYYDRVLFNLISKYNNRTQSLNKIDKITSLMDKTEGMTKKSSEFEERLVYGNAHRKLRTQLQKELQSLKLDDRAMLLLKNELPLLDNLNSICLSYSGALEETRQEATYLATHLMQVKESYFDMMRSHRVNKNLEGEASKLLSYADNMNNSLRKCSNEIVQKANDNSLFSAHYEQRTLTLDSVLNDIEDSNSGAFNQLENKISAYLQP